MKTYIGYAKKQGGGNVFFHPCYILENGELKRNTELKSEKLTGACAGLQGLIRADVDDGRSNTVYQSFPKPGDDWLYVIELNQTIESLKDKRLTTPLPKVAFYPKDNTEVFVYSKTDKELFGPIRVREEKQDVHRVLKLDITNGQTVQREIKEIPGYHLHIAPKKAFSPNSMHPPTPVGAPEITKSIIRWIIDNPVSDIFLEPLVPEDGRDNKERALCMMGGTVRLQKNMLDVYRKLYKTGEDTGKASPWLQILHECIIPGFEAKLEAAGNAAAICAANAADYKKHILFLSHAAQILECKDSAQLYEYYCLLRIVNVLTAQLGFVKTEVQSVGCKTVKGTENLANMLHFERKELEVTLYREPEISGEKHGNGLWLYRRFADACCRPDFVLKIETKEKDKGCRYVILDAKFHCEQDKGTGEGQLSKIIDKYFLQLGTIHKSDSVAMVWILQGGASCPSLNPSSLERKYGPFPSFGSCIVNEHAGQGMEPFMRVFTVLLDSLRNPGGESGR